MSGYRIGSNVFGTDAIKTTTLVDEEIIPQTLTDAQKVKYRVEKFVFNRFSIMNTTDMLCSVNGGDFFFVPANVGVNFKPQDLAVHSFVMKNIGTSYYYLGGL